MREDQQQEPPYDGDHAAEPHEALTDPVCLRCIFAHAADVRTLASLELVCSLWRGLLAAQDIWRAVYLADHSALRPHEGDGRCASSVGGGGG